MVSKLDKQTQDHLDQTCLYVLRALPSAVDTDVEAHIAVCEECQREIERVRPIVDTFVAWPTDVLRPNRSLWPRLAQRVAAAGVPIRIGNKLLPAFPARFFQRKPTRVALACSCDWRLAGVIPRIAMLDARSCICFTASCGSMTESSVRATTIAPNQAPTTRGSGAKPAVLAC